MKLNRNDVREIALAHGFTLRPQKDAPFDLNEYVYKFADAIADYTSFILEKEKQKMNQDDLFQGNTPAANSQTAYDMQKEFEEWASSAPCNYNIDRVKEGPLAGEYAYLHTFAAWEAWQEVHKRMRKQPQEPKTNQTANSHQVGGDHYKNLAIEPWDVVATWNYEQQVGFYRGNVLKYLLRAFSKGKPVEDLLKAAHYLQKLIEVVAKEQEDWDACKL